MQLIARIAQFEQKLYTLAGMGGMGDLSHKKSAPIIFGESGSIQEIVIDKPSSSLAMNVSFTQDGKSISKLVIDKQSLPAFTSVQAPSTEIPTIPARVDKDVAMNVPLQIQQFARAGQVHNDIGSFTESAGGAINFKKETTKPGHSNVGKKLVAKPAKIQRNTQTRKVVAPAIIQAVCVSFCRVQHAKPERFGP